MGREFESRENRDLGFDNPVVNRVINTLSETASRLKLRIILKGGAVRDILWNYFYGTDYFPGDLDFSVNKGIHSLHGKLLDQGVTMVGRTSRKGSVVFKYLFPGAENIDVDIGPMISDPLLYEKNWTWEKMLKADAERSDLRVNSMSVELEPKKHKWSVYEVYDPLGGINDIQKRSLNLADSQKLTSPNTILRAVRIALQLGAELSDETIRLIALGSSDITRVPYHLLYSEAAKIISSHDYHRAVEVLHGSGVIDAMFPGRVLEAGSIFKLWFSDEAPQYTVIMLKPDGVRAQLQVEIIKGLVERGLVLAARKVIRLTTNDISNIYPAIRNEWLIPRITAHLTSGCCEALLFMGNGAIDMARDFIGSTALEDRLPSGIRGKYSENYIKNIAHTPDSDIELRRTTKVIFPELPLPKAETHAS